MREAIDPSSNALLGLLGDFLSKEIESIRVARILFALLQVKQGLSREFPDNALPQWRGTQHHDGGWSDPEETAWAIAVLSQLSEKNSEVVNKAMNWLGDVRHSAGGWGRHPRDQVRIPTTALVISLVPSIATPKDKAWIRQAWEKDLNRPVHLSYKGGFYLLAANSENAETIDPLVSRTIAYLADDQNDDGGFGPWRGHPVGSDPWSTGVVLWGLSKWIDYADPVIIEKALAWLEKTQLPSGYWAYHYLDEGTSYALIGAVSALRALKKL